MIWQMLLWPLQCRATDACCYPYREWYFENNEPSYHYHGQMKNFWKQDVTQSNAEFHINFSVDLRGPCGSLYLFQRRNPTNCDPLVRGRSKDLSNVLLVNRKVSLEIRDELYQKSMLTFLEAHYGRTEGTFREYRYALQHMPIPPHLLQRITLNLPRPADADTFQENVMGLLDSLPNLKYLKLLYDHYRGGEESRDRKAVKDVLGIVAAINSCYVNLSASTIFVRLGRYGKRISSRVSDYSYMARMGIEFFPYNEGASTAVRDLTSLLVLQADRLIKALILTENGVSPNEDFVDCHASKLLTLINSLIEKGHQKCRRGSYLDVRADDSGERSSFFEVDSEGTERTAHLANEDVFDE